MLPYYDEFDDYGITIHDDTRIAQSFTTAEAVQCNGAVLWLARLGTPAGTLTVALYGVDGGGHPTGGPLASGTLGYSGLPTEYPGVPCSAVFSSPIALAASTRYAVVVFLSAGNEWNAIRLTYMMVGTYAGGKLQASTDAGVNWSDSAGDLRFATMSSANRFYVGGELSAGSYLHLVGDDGATLSQVYGVPTSTIPAPVVALAAGPTMADGLFVGCTDGKVYKMSRLTWGLDTSWATSGVYTAPAAIAGLATDTAGYLAVACAGSGTTPDVVLLDAAGAPVWSRAFSGAADVGSAVGFNASTGNPLFGPLFTGGGTPRTPQVLELARTDGSTLVTRGDDSQTWSSIGPQVRYTAGSEPYWYSRSKTGTSEVVSASAGTMTVNPFALDSIQSFDVAIGASTTVTIAALGGIFQQTRPDPTTSQYDTGGTSHALSRVGGVLYVAGDLAENEDSQTENISLLDATSLARLRGLALGTGALHALAIVDVTDAPPSKTAPIVTGTGKAGTPAVLRTVGLFSVGAPSGIDATHPVVITVKDSSGSTICSKTFDDVTVFPTNGYAELGGSLSASLSTTAPITVSIDPHIPGTIPECWICYVFLRDSHLMMSGIRMAAS